MFDTIACATAAAVLLTSGILRFRSYAHTPRGETKYLAVALTAFGAAFLLNVPPIVRILDAHVWRLNDASILASHLLGLVTVWGGIELCAEAAGHGPRRRPKRLSILGFACCVLVAAFVAAGHLAEAPQFFVTYAHDPRLRFYWIAFLGCVILGGAYLSFIAHAHTHHDDRWLRRGLNLIAAGSGLICAFMISRLLGLGLTSPAWIDTLAVAVLAVGSCSLAAGAALPQLAGYCYRRAARQQLYPLWHAATAPYPDVRERHEPASLYRMIIEIQDAVAEARSRGQLESPLMRALDQLPVRSSDDVDSAVNDLLQVAQAQHLQLQAS
jgi:hypothetical protein